MKKFTTLSAILLALCLCFTACATPVDSSSLNSSSSYPDSSQELDYYVVTYTENGNRGEIKVKKGESCTPYTPEPREGYVFTGWFLNGTLISGSFIPEGDVEIEGIWERYDLLAEELKASLKKYLSSEAFAKAVTDAKTTQARIPLLYLKYIDGNYYTPELVEQFKNYLNMIDGVILDGKISDSLYSSSDVSKTGWYGIPDFLYSWSAIYNQYALASVALKYDNAYGKYFDLISEYLTNLDKFQSNSNKKYEWNGEEVTQSNLYYKGYNAINNIANASSRLSKDEFVSLLSCIATATKNTDGHAAFIAKYETIDFESMDASTDKNKLYTALKAELMPMWKDCMPVTQVAFGYGIYNVILLTAYNLGLDLKQVTPVSLEYMLSYYKKDESGNFIKNGGTPNWVGFSGRPLAGSVLRSYKEYDVKFEKTMQGYFPFTDGWNQPLDQLINMDRLCNFYNHDLGAKANVAPHYGILYGYMNGIDMEHYKKEVYHSEVCPGVENCEYHIDETVGQVYNVITLWRETLSKDEEGNYVISNTGEMSVAIAYCAYIQGIEAPSPLGLYNKADSVIKL